MSTPRLPTYIRTKIEERDRQAQTAFPAKVLDWNSSTNTVRLEPQFIETWVLRDGTRTQEDAENTFIDNVPVCYPWHITWDITVGAFGLVICTKYSLDLWRQQLNRIDPGDLRRFTMSGATFHPVVIGESPNATQQYVALANLIVTELSSIRTVLNTHKHTGVATGSGSSAISDTLYRAPAAPTEADVGSTTVKVSE